MNVDPDGTGATIYDLMARYDLPGVTALLTSRSDGLLSEHHQHHITPVCAAFVAFLAARNGREKNIARQIISLVVNAAHNKSDILNRSNANGLTPLMLAIECGEPEFIEHLIRSGADVNLMSHNQTPLGFALGRRFSAAVRIVLRHGANPNNSVNLIDLMKLTIDHEERDILWLLATGHMVLLQTLLMQHNCIAYAMDRKRFRIAMDLRTCTLPVPQANRSRAFVDQLLRGEPAAWSTAGIPTDDPFCTFVVMLLLKCGDNTNAVNVLWQLSASQVPGFQPAFRNALTFAIRTGNIGFFNQLKNKEMVATYFLQEAGEALIDELLEDKPEELIVFLLEQGANPGLPDGSQWSATAVDFFSRACKLGKRKVVAAALNVIDDPDVVAELAAYAAMSPLLTHILQNDDIGLLTLLDDRCHGHISRQTLAIYSLGFPSRKCSRYLLQRLPDVNSESILESALSSFISQIQSRSDTEKCVAESRELILVLIDALCRKNIDVERLAANQLLRCAVVPQIIYILTSVGANPCELLQIGLRDGVEVSSASMQAALEGLMQFILHVEEFNLQAIRRLALELLSPHVALFDLLLQCTKHMTLDNKVKDTAEFVRDRLLQWQDTVEEDAPDPLLDISFLATITSRPVDEIRQMLPQSYSIEVVLFIKRWLECGEHWPPVSLMRFLVSFLLWKDRPRAS